jgi:uncharacterized protein (TIGR03000 family)
VRRTKYYTAAIVVLMAMFFAADASAGWGWKHRHRGFGRYYSGGWGGYYGGGWGGYYGGGWGGYYSSGWRGYYGTGWGGYYGSRWGAGYSPYSYYGGYAMARPSYAYYGSGTLYGSYGYGCASCYSAPVYTRTGWAAPVYSCVPLQCGCVAACGCDGTVTGTVIDDGYQQDNQDGYIEQAPSAPPEAAPQPQDGAKTHKSQIRNSIVLSVSSPADAKIYVNDHETKITGPRRKFRSSRLEIGKPYTYRVKAVYEGRAITKFVTALPGQQANMSFDFASQETVATVLRLNVPESAQVTLGGAETKQQGPQRVFGTNRLSPGESWDNYVVRVSVEKNGRTVTQERTISLSGGESYEMQFEFDENVLASK